MSTFQLPFGKVNRLAVRLGLEKTASESDYFALQLGLCLNAYEGTCLIH